MKIAFHRCSGRGFMSAALGLIFVLASRVGAQTEFVSVMEPVQVTAQKRLERIQEVPAALNAFTGSFLNDFHLRGVDELAPFTPGLFVSQQSANLPSYNIRGITSDSTDPRQPPRVSVFQDGVSLRFTQESAIEFFDLDQVEVLKGPQGPLFGREAEIGAISLHSKRAENHRSAELSVTGGDHGSRSTTGYVNEPISSGIAARVAFVARSEDGTVPNLAGGRALGSKNTQAGRLSLRLNPVPSTQMDVIIDAEHDNPSGTPYKSGVIPTRAGDTDPYRPADMNRGDGLYVDRTIWGAVILTETSLSEHVHFATTTAARGFDSLESFDADGSSLYLLESEDDVQGHHYSEEVRLSLAYDPWIKASFGASWSSETGREKAALLTDERLLWPFLSASFRTGLIQAGLPSALANAAVPILNPFAPQSKLPATFAVFAQPGLPASLQALSTLGGAPLKSYQEEHYVNGSKNDHLDLFTDETWSPYSRLKLTAGGRFTHEHSRSSYEVIDSATPGTLGFILGAAPNDGFIPTHGIRRSDTNSNGVTGRLALQYDWTPEFTTYATAARGRRAPAVVVDAKTSTVLQEEQVNSAEIGTRGVTDGGRLHYSASIFFYHYRHFQTFVADPSAFARFIEIDAGSATGKGAELTAEYRMSSAVQLLGSWGLTDVTFDGRGANGTAQLYANNRLRLTSKNTATLGGRFNRSLGKNGLLHLYVWGEYRSSLYFDDDNAKFGGALRQPPYTLGHLRLDWTSASATWAIAASVRNAFDHRYLIDAGNTGAVFGIPTFVRGQPRRMEVSVTRRL